MWGPGKPFFAPLSIVDPLSKGGDEMTDQTRIGIIGKGDVGTSLQEGFEGAGYQVEIAGHNEKDVRRVAEDCDMLVLAVPHGELENAIKECQGAHKGKIVVDVSNITDEDGNFTGNMKESRAEILQKNVPEAKVIKAFNTVFAPNMPTGSVGDESLSLFVAGDDESARHRVEQIGRDMGYDPVDAGPLRNARYLEALGYLNMQLASEQGMGDQIGFRLVHEE
jgi:8-hydroxy-5-deazaflavin:NADPH oxidoreductase